MDSACNLTLLIKYYLKKLNVPQESGTSVKIKLVWTVGGKCDLVVNRKEDKDVQEVVAHQISDFA